MKEPAAKVEVAMRIPGRWENPGELIEKLPSGYRVTPEAMILPDGTRIDFGAMQPDGEFAKIFRISCRRPARDDELAAVDAYTVNACLSGPAGSLESARTMMQAAAALVRAGGAGVFIDNSGLAHGGRDWLELTDDGGTEAVSFAFVSVTRRREDVTTMGMHVLGLRDVVMKRADAEQEEFGILDVLRYLVCSTRAVEDGHVLADLSGPRFQVVSHPAAKELVGSVMHNPFGRLRLVSMKNIAEAN